MKKPIIGIVGRNEVTKDNYRVTCTYDMVRMAVLKHGAVPIGIMPTQQVIYTDSNLIRVPKLTLDEKSMLSQQLEMCDGLILPGGNKYFEHDEFLLKKAIEDDMPVLGICLGMQLMAGVCCSKNYEPTVDKTKKILSEINHKTKSSCTHEILIKTGSKLFDIFKTTSIMVNSSHNYQADITDFSCAAAMSPDGVTEAVELPGTFAIGVQWHPELMLGDKYSEKLLDRFVDESKAYKCRKTLSR